jgi:MSHA biogenesis protein MshQ
MNLTKMLWVSAIAVFSALSSAHAQAGVDHYQLDYNSQNNSVTATACANSACSSWYKDKKTKLHLTEDNGNEGLFLKFHNLNSGRETQYGILTYGQCRSLRLQAKGNSSNPAAPLKCFADGAALPGCEICNRPVSSDEGIYAAYVYGDISLGFLPEGEFTVDSLEGGVAGGNFLTSPGQDRVMVGTKVNSGAKLTYDRAGQITVGLKSSGEGHESNKKYTVKLAFVPKQLKWKTQHQCEINSTFIYQQHSEACPALGRVGDNLTLALVAYGEEDKRINQYSAELAGIRVYELDEQLEPNNQSDYPSFRFLQDLNSEGEITHKVKTVGLIEAYMPSFCAGFAENEQGNCVLQTQGDSVTLGRTVPASLHIVETVTGDIEGNVAYAGQPEIPFSTEPSFTLVGWDINGNALPSYSGEFAGGLESNITLNLETGREHDGLNWHIQEPETGRHVITLDTDSLSFHKTAPFPQTPLNLPLGLAINSHDGTRGGNGETSLAQENDSLRFGFVGLMDAEIKVGEPGAMASKLFYFGNSITTVVEDSNTDYDFGGGATVAYQPVPSPELALSLAPRGVEVGAYGRQHQGTRVTVEGLPDWLKPEVGGVLTDPSAMLDILDNSRKRANDSTFNRREVIR